VDRSFVARRFRRLATDEDGVTASEYAIMLALIIVVCVATLTAYGQNLGTKWVDIDSTLFG